MHPVITERASQCSAAGCSETAAHCETNKPLRPGTHCLGWVVAERTKGELDPGRLAELVKALAKCSHENTEGGDGLVRGW